MHEQMLLCNMLVAMRLNISMSLFHDVMAGVSYYIENHSSCSFGVAARCLCSGGKGVASCAVSSDACFQPGFPAWHDCDSGMLKQIDSNYNKRFRYTYGRSPSGYDQMCAHACDIIECHILTRTRYFGYSSVMIAWL